MGINHLSKTRLFDVKPQNINPEKRVNLQNNKQPPTAYGHASYAGDNNLTAGLTKANLFKSYEKSSPSFISSAGNQNKTGSVADIQMMGGSSKSSPTELNFEESKSISDIAYDGKEGEVYKFPDGSYWRVDKAEDNSDTGFKAVAMRKVVSDGAGGYIDDPNDDRVVIGFAGTDDLMDVVEDINNATGKSFMSAQRPQAMAFTEEVQKEAKENGETVNLTGHSLGGGLATYVSIQTGLKATAINSAPLDKGDVPDDVNYDDQITQYHSPEILTGLDNVNPLDTRPGKEVVVEGKYNDYYTPWGINETMTKNHMLENTAPDVPLPEKVS